MVDDCVGMHHAGGDLLAGLVQKSHGVGQSALFLDGSGGGRPPRTQKSPQPESPAAVEAVGGEGAA